MKRGEVRWYTFTVPDKRRPVLILTRNTSIGVLNALTIVPITSTVRNVPSEVFLDDTDGLANECAANLHSLQTVPKDKLGRSSRLFLRGSCRISSRRYILLWGSGRPYRSLRPSSHTVEPYSFHTAKDADDYLPAPHDSKRSYSPPRYRHP